MVLKLKYNLSCVKTNISLGAPIRMHDYERLNSWHTAYESGSHFYDDIKAVEGWCVLSVNNL